MAMKFRAHETFFIRKGWLSKGMKYVQNRPDVFVSKKENPMDVLGIGSNMVKALRYWLQTVGLTSEPHAGRRTQNEKTLHADLLLSGITQLITVVLANKIHQHKYLRSLKPLIA